jgi:hypothetical protein
MFLRVVRATVSKGVKREYVRVVEAYRDRDGKTRHRAVINLGRRDVLAEHLDLGKLRRLLHGDAAGDDRDIGRSERGTGGRCWRRAGCGAISASTNSRGPIAARWCG